MSNDMDAIYKIADLVSNVVGKSYHWTAKQSPTLDGAKDWYAVGWQDFGHLGWRSDGNGFVGFFGVTLSEVRQAMLDQSALDAPVTRLATEVMGCAPGSQKDFANRIAVAIRHLNDVEARIGDLMTERDRCRNVLDALQAKHAAAIALDDLIADS